MTTSTTTITTARMRGMATLGTRVRRTSTRLMLRRR